MMMTGTRRCTKFMSVSRSPFVCESYGRIRARYEYYCDIIWMIFISIMSMTMRMRWLPTIQRTNTEEHFLLKEGRSRNDDKFEIRVWWEILSFITIVFVWVHNHKEFAYLCYTHFEALSSHHQHHIHSFFLQPRHYPRSFFSNSAR